jgi:uncharacterized membrane-anchored protein
MTCSYTGRAIIMIASFTSLIVSQHLSDAPSAIDVAARDGSSLVMIVGAVLFFLLAVTVVKGVIGVMARVAEVAIAIGGTVMVVGLLGFGGVALYLMNMVGFGPFR